MDFISMSDFTKEQIISVLDTAQEVKNSMLDAQAAEAFKQKHGRSVSNLLGGIHVANLFLENSTRTNYSFRTAVTKAGGNVDGFPSKVYTSLAKGETWADTVAMFAGWGYDAIVMRSKIEGLPRWTKESLMENYSLLNQQHSQIGYTYNRLTPLVINGGDGKNQHPTQCLLDLFTMREIARKHGKTLDGMHLALLNDLAHGRTNASLMSVAHLFNFKLHFAYPNRFGPQKRHLQKLKERGVEINDHKENFLDAMRCAFIAYHSRPQKERVGKGEDLITIKQIGQIRKAMYDQLGDDAPYLMHPLPVDAETFEEIAHDMNSHPKNITKFQSANGLYVRIALLALGFNRVNIETQKGNRQERIPPKIIELPISSNAKQLQNPRSGYIKQQGVVLDHIPAGRGRRLEGMLGFEIEKPALVSAYNIPGGKMQGKDIIKLHDNYTFSSDQLQALALIAPSVTISFVQDGIVTKKMRPVLGNFIEKRIKCDNGACVTNVEKEHVTPKHYISGSEMSRIFTCHYCEDTQTMEEAYQKNNFIYIKPRKKSVQI